MAYSSDITKTLTEQITKFATLHRHQLAGHLANLDFWAAEVRHCLEVIDGYGRRFERMKAAQLNLVTDAWLGRVPSRELRETRRQLCDAFYRFLIRCFREGLIDESSLRRVCGTLDIGVESSDLRSRP